MNAIIFPLKLRMEGPAVADLQAALRLLLDQALLLPTDLPGRNKLIESLGPEAARSTFADMTQRLVGMFQELRHLHITGEVDQPTADALNAHLRDLGMLDRPPTPAALVVSGAVRREDGLPVQALLVRAAHEAERSAVRLGEDETDAAGLYTIRYELLPGLSATNLRITATAADGKVVASSDLIRNARPLEQVDLTIPVAAPSSVQRMIEGQVILEHGLPAEQLTLRLYRRDFGGTATLLKETTTLAGGQYAFAYDPGGKAASLEVRAVSAANQEIPLTRPINDLSEERKGLNLVAPGSLKPLTAEYQRLAGDLTSHVGQMAKLAEARENADRQDLTVLNRATGWDARLIALAATAERLNADPDVNLPPEGLYGLLRAGLPSDKLLLAQVSPDVAEQALKTVRDTGIVALTDPQITQIKADFGTFASKARLAIPAPGSRSTYGALLKGSGLSDAAQATFAPVYLKHRGDPEALWGEARKAGLDDAQIGKLRLQGKLAFLAGNSEGMTSRLMQRGINDPVQLVDQDFHLPDSWVKEILAQAGIPEDRRNALTAADKTSLEAIIPAAHGGGNIEGRLDAYADEMARKVRLSYPTQVIGRMIEKGDINVPAAGAATAKLLKSAAAQGFRLGQTPVTTFLESHAGAKAGVAVAELPAAEQQMRTLQRVYQITPSNEAMPVLMSLGMTSAYDVMAYSEAEFMVLFAKKYFDLYGKSPAVAESRLVYRKARQVSSVTYNLFTIAKKLDTETVVAAVSAPPAVRDGVRNELIRQFPTMESLFGSMDFCECEHCRSVLSPAAYLVDLLQFVDTESGVWANSLARWQATHGGQDYPHQDANGKPLKPYDALVMRRPDLPNISLTCENTHTALPYIDIVNEILEYYVAHGRLEDKAARDTGEATTDELFAEPQNVIREAYDTLRTARYPMTLPFDLWIDTARQFCQYFETPLARVLEVFRPSDDLFAPAQSFDRSSIFIESLGMSPAEWAMFTDPDPLGNDKWVELYGFANAVDAAALASAKTLSRRLGVTYKEVAALVQTGFVNPKLEKLALLDKLGVSIRDARLFIDHKALVPQDPATLSAEDQKLRLEAESFATQLTALAAAFQTTTVQLEAEVAAIPFGDILVLADPDVGCNFDLTTLQYADGKKPAPIDFLRLNLFVRLWRKLGWTIDETDRALQTFVAKSAPFETAHLAKKPLQTALISVAHLKALDERVKLGKQSRTKLPALWADIPTTGKKPLYAQLFLTRSVLKASPVFDHPLGQYLTDASVKVRDHLLALQGALGLTAEEVGLILTDVGMAMDTAVLSLPNVSLLYRHALLAKALKLQVRKLIALKRMSGLDPFTPIHPDPLSDTAPGVVPGRKAIEFDHPFSQTLRFVEVSEEIKESGLDIEDLEYLLRHRFDETGKYRPNPDGTVALLRMLSEGVRAIRTEHAVPEDPGTLSDEVLKLKLGLALPADVVETFMAMMSGTAEFTATASGVAPGTQLMPKTFADEPSVRGVSYSAARQEQKFTFRGVVFDTAKLALMGRLPSALLGTLLDDIQRQARNFFDKHLQKQAANVQPAAGFLDGADFALFFDPDMALAGGETEQDRVRTRRAKLASAFLPFLQQRLIRQLVVQTMTAQTGADPVLVESLLTDERLLSGPRPLLEALAGAGERGVGAAFFDSNDGSGARQPTSPTASDANTALKPKKDAANNGLNPANSARFVGYLEVPAAGAYRFHVVLDKSGAEAELRFRHLPDPVFWKGAAAVDGAVLGVNPAEFLELKPSIPYRFSLDLRKLGGGEARLLVEGETLPKGQLSQLTVYPVTAIEEAERAMLLLEKTLQLVQGLGLTERELRYLLTHAAPFDGLNLSQLPTAVADDTPVRARALFDQFLRLAAYTRLKRDMAGGTDDLIGVFEANGTLEPDRLEKRVYPLLARLTRREESVVRATAQDLFAVPQFESERPLQRLWEALQVVERFGVPVASLRSWTRIVNGATTPEQRFQIARDLREAIKARFEQETWQRVAQPIFDTLRRRQRDALAAHVMHQQGFASLEQLYEYFLIDPGMEPVVQTSRVRLAIASVQLFIQRSLLNMELKVHPSVINSKQWEWMKRYRVWEANRKIFLFPENWLEPEFRDDKTHLFAELEGALLQGDVSSDLVEDAFLGYLRKLDELARLDIAAVHLEDDADPARRTLHVIGRTYSLPHKYFYRRYAHQMWTAWEPVGAEIEGEHLAPVIWRDRLYLFWVTFMDKPTANLPTASTGTLTDASLSSLATDLQSVIATKVVDLQLHWCEYLQGEWTTRESGGYSAAVSETVSSSFDPQSAFIHVSKAYEAGEERGVYIHVSDPIDQAFYLAGRNSAPEQAGYASRPDNPYTSANTDFANRYRGSGALSVTYQERLTTEPGKTPPKATPSILRQSGGGYTVVPCNSNLTALGVPEDAYRTADNPAAVKSALEAGVGEIACLMMPVFYQDNAHTFFVEPNVRERTIEEWQDWITRTPMPVPDGLGPGIIAIPEIPRYWPLPGPRIPQFNIDPGSLINPKPAYDWLVNPGTALLYDGTPIGAAGRAGLEILPALDTSGRGAVVKVNPASGLGAGSSAVLTGATTLEHAGLQTAPSGLNLVGGAGFNHALASNFNELSRSGFGAGAPKHGGLGR